MRQPIVRIYLTANLAVYLLFALFLFPEGLGIGIIASLCSAVFSAPALFVLYACFSLLKRYRFNLTISWLLLLIAVSFCAFVPVLVCGILFGVEMFLDKEFLLLSFGSAFAGTLLQGFYINNYFNSLQHKIGLSDENN